jgi:hypothetical protein
MDKTRMISILTAEPEAADCLMATANRHAFVDTLKGIVFPPEDLADLTFVIKSHPRSDISQWLRECMGSGVTNVRILDPSTSVMELLQTTWLTVICDHYGSVAVQAVLAEKPVIFLDSAAVFWPYTEKLAFAAGRVVESTSGLWDLIRHLKASPEVYEELSEKCRRFKAEYLRPAERTLAARMRFVEQHPVPMTPDTEIRATIQSGWGEQII